MPSDEALNCKLFVPQFGYNLTSIYSLNNIMYNQVWVLFELAYQVLMLTCGDMRVQLHLVATIIITCNH